MKKILLIVCTLVLVFPVTADQWQTYENQKYSYQIQYPENYEFRVTGSKKERDGRSFLVALKEISSMHGLHGTIYPGMSLEELAVKENAPAWAELEPGPVLQTTNNLKIIWLNTSVNGKKALVAELRAPETDELLLTRILMKNVEFSVQLWGDFNQEVAGQIVSTFRFDE